MRLLSLFIFSLILAQTSVATAQESLPTVLATPKQLAETLRQEGKWQQLSIISESWTNKEPHNWRSWYYYGIAKLELADIPSAVVFFERAQFLSAEENVELVLRIADGYAALGNWATAEAGYRETLKDKAEHPALWGKLRLAIAAQEGEVKRQEEIIVLEKILTFEEYSNHYDLWLRQAELLDSFSQTDKARIAYGNALRIRPKDLKTAEWIFRYDVAAGDEDAIEIGKKHLLKLDGNHPLVNVYMGDAALARGTLSKANRYYRVAIVNPNYRHVQARAYTGLGKIYGGTNNNRSLENYLAAIRSDPSYLPGWDGAVIVLRSLNKHSQASRYLSRKQLIKRRIESGEALTKEMLSGL